MNACYCGAYACDDPECALHTLLVEIIEEIDNAQTADGDVLLAIRKIAAKHVEF